MMLFSPFISSFRFLGSLLLLACAALGCSRQEALPASPNFLLIMSDNQSYNHLGCYGDPVVRTPHIDSLAARGVRFTHAFCAAPSCTPARAALLAGQDIWRLGEGANLWSTLADSIPTYVDLLEAAGYLVGHDRKGWGPGNYEAGGRSRNPAGYTFEHFGAFLDSNAQQRPWSYWLSSRHPHRPFEHGAGLAAGLDPQAVEVPPYLPDAPEIREDILDYYHSIMKFDQEVGQAMDLLRKSGQLEQTVIMLCSDNGWMMPRGLANLYDFGTRVPLIVSWPRHFPPGREVADFVSLNDLAPTILELAGLPIPPEFTARSLLPLLTSSKQGRIDSQRNFIVTARERHAIARKNGLGYPARALRTYDYLYIHNLAPERWPAGDPPLFGDIDLHMLQDQCPTKEYMMAHKDLPQVRPLYELAFLKRPEEELFDLQKDPWQMHNLAYDPAYSPIKQQLKQQLNAYLRQTADPRILGLPVYWDTQAYYKEKDWIGTPREEAQKKFGLKAAYPYREE